MPCGLAYEADIVAATAGLNTGDAEIDKAMDEKLMVFLYNSEYLETLKANKLNVNHILDIMSLKIAFDYAQEHNMPCVVNCSWGMYFGYADHHDVVDEFVSKLLGPGRILVCSAGNDGNKNIYIEKPADQYEWTPTPILYSSNSSFQIHSEDEFEFDFKMWEEYEDSPFSAYGMSTPLTSAIVRNDYDKATYYTPGIEWTWKDKNGKEHDFSSTGRRVDLHSTVVRSPRLLLPATTSYRPAANSTPAIPRDGTTTTNWSWHVAHITTRSARCSCSAVRRWRRQS